MCYWLHFICRWSHEEAVSRYRGWSSQYDDSVSAPLLSYLYYLRVGAGLLLILTQNMEHRVSEAECVCIYWYWSYKRELIERGGRKHICCLLLLFSAAPHKVPWPLSSGHPVPGYPGYPSCPRMTSYSGLKEPKQFLIKVSKSWWSWCLFLYVILKCFC